jgi:hypothetical protein
MSLEGNRGQIKSLAKCTVRQQPKQDGEEAELTWKQLWVVLSSKKSEEVMKGMFPTHLH